jgi:hypothetical protein
MQYLSVGITREDLAEPPGSAPASLIAPALHGLLYYASLAPSGHNAQPWTVRPDGRDIWVGTDSARWLPKVDPANREVMLSVGAFLENLITAAPAHGFVADYEVAAAQAATDVVRVVLKSTAPHDAPLERLRERRTTRSGQLARDISTADVQALRAAAGNDEMLFFAAGSPHGRQLAEATLEANRLQTARDDAQSELADWMRWTREDGRAHRNGFTPESLDITGIAGWYVRHFMNKKAVLGKRFRKQSLDLVRRQLASYGGWIVITSKDESVPALIDAGRCCERMWLDARSRSIAVHPMSQVLEEAPLKDQIAGDLGMPGRVQFVLRIGYVTAYPRPVSLRMPVSWFLRNGEGSWQTTQRI